MTTTVRIPPYSDDDLVAGEHLAGDPAFWLAHLLITLGSLSEDVTEYGVETSRFEELMERLGDPEQPPTVLRVPFAGGHQACAVYVNDEDESNIDFIVQHPAWGRLGWLGQHGPHGSGNGLSWRELTKLAAGAPDGTPDGLSDPAQRLLLLLPVLGDAATPAAEAVETVARAIVEVGLRPDTAGELAAYLLNVPGLSRQPVWTVTPESPIRVCDSDYSPRRIPLALGITPAQAQALAEALS
ncbi:MULTISPECIES: hypothetical protein [Kitasatospora]|uniref:hypothetical protein n=1 Tax=Kitasatospora TaxID=2063 RepID=UPI000CB0058A|nr:hypothetical protein [Kitasatospora sp. GP30]MDH6143826.1 hypothetical protein [Kitasatospora sp. GP30]